MVMLADQCQTVAQPKYGAKTADINPTKPRQKTPNLRDMWSWYTKIKNPHKTNIGKLRSEKNAKKYHDHQNSIPGIWNFSKQMYKLTDNDYKINSK